MDNADYLRTRAAMCLQLARFISDRLAAEELKSKAADYHARAIEIESRQQSPPLKTFRS